MYILYVLCAYVFFLGNFLFYFILFYKIMACISKLYSFKICKNLQEDISSFIKLEYIFYITIYVN